MTKKVKHYYASKEEATQARKALDALEAICNVPPETRKSRYISKIRRFLEAAHAKLPGEAAYARDRQRRALKASA